MARIQIADIPYEASPEEMTVVSGGISSEPVYTTNPLAISSEPVYTSNPLAISSEPVYRSSMIKTSTQLTKTSLYS